MKKIIAYIAATALYSAVCYSQRGYFTPSTLVGDAIVTAMGALAAVTVMSITGEHDE